MTMSIYIYATVEMPDERIDAMAVAMEPFVQGSLRQARHAGPPLEAVPERYWRSLKVTSALATLSSDLQALMNALLASGVKELGGEIGIVIVEEYGEDGAVRGFNLPHSVLSLASQLGADIDIDIGYSYLLDGT